MLEKCWILGVLLILFIHCDKKQTTSPEDKKTPTLSALHTEGRWIADEENEKVILRGVNIPSLEWTSEGDNMMQSLVWTIDEWKANIARIPLSQDRWFGYASEQNDGGESYRTLVDQLVQIASEKEAYIWLDLHWNNTGKWGQYIGQHKMPDKNSLYFWQDVSKKYANNPAVLFGLYNEPHNISWDVWLDGGEISEEVEVNGENQTLTFNAVGHQELFDAIRNQGAQNIVIAAGLDWGFDLSGILDGYALQGENIVYDTHPYPWKSSDWDFYFGDVGQHYPIIVGEWGGKKDEGQQKYGIDLANYMRRHKLCWTAWCFHPSAGPQLIKDWNYNPTWFGELVIRELADPIIFE